MIKVEDVSNSNDCSENIRWQESKIITELLSNLDWLPHEQKLAILKTAMNEIKLLIDEEYNDNLKKMLLDIPILPDDYIDSIEEELFSIQDDCEKETGFTYYGYSYEHTDQSPQSNENFISKIFKRNQQPKEELEDTRKENTKLLQIHLKQVQQGLEKIDNLINIKYKDNIIVYKKLFEQIPTAPGWSPDRNRDKLDYLNNKFWVELKKRSKTLIFFMRLLSLKDNLEKIYERLYNQININKINNMKDKL